MGEPDYYELLGVAKNATLHDIRTKFRQKVLAEHPDKGGDPKKFQLLNKAYNVLTDQDKRKRYDATGRPERTAEEEFADAFGGGRMKGHQRPKEADAEAVVTMQERMSTGPAQHEDGFAEWLRQRDQSEMVLTDKDFMKTALFNAAELTTKIQFQGSVQHVLSGSGQHSQAQVKPKALKKTLDHDEILVRMIAVPIDKRMVQPEATKGACLGSTGVGRIEQVGSKCGDFRANEPVLVLPRPTKFTSQRPIGTGRTLLICQEEDVIKIPSEIMEELTPEQLCLIPSLVCAYILLEAYSTKLQPGDSVLMNAAHYSDSGFALLQLCRLLKLKPLCILELPGAPVTLAKGEYGSSSVWQDAESPMAPLAIKERYEQLTDRLQSMGAEEVFPDAVAMLKWRERNQRMRPKLGLDGIASGHSAEQLIHCLASGDKETQLLIYGGGSGAPLDLPSPLVSAWGGHIMGFDVARWVHETPEHAERMMGIVENMTKLVRANKFQIDTVLFKVGEDPISDAIQKQMDCAPKTQVVLIFPTLREEEEANGGATHDFNPEPRRAAAGGKAPQAAAPQRKEDEERMKLQNEWLDLLFTTQSVAASHPEGSIGASLSSGNSSSIALVVWVGDSPKGENPLLQEVMSTFANVAFVSAAWTEHTAAEALNELDLSAPEVCDGSFYLRGRGTFENSDLDNLHDMEVLGRALVDLVQRKLMELKLDWKNVVLCGFGKGSGIALYAAVLKLIPNQIAGMVLFSPIVLFPSFLAEKIQQRPEAGKMQQMKLFLVWGQQDRSTPGQYKQLLANSLKKASEVQCTPDTIADGGHSFSSKSSSMLLSLLPLCLPR